jgi:hypothetical protein
MLGHADSGEYSGETVFLTSPKQLDDATLESKTFALLQPMRALMVLTDGVADDYFPADPGMARLYADLVLNGVLQASGADGTFPPELTFDPNDGRLNEDAEAIRAEGAVPVKLRSAALAASELGIATDELARRPNLLQACAREAPLQTQANEAQERLRIWLDSYQVRGSFDDRTLVALQPC